MDTELLLDIQGMSVEFPGIKALDSVDFTLRKGEVVALLGENGAGKSKGWDMCVIPFSEYITGMTQNF